MALRNKIRQGININFVLETENEAEKMKLSSNPSAVINLLLVKANGIH